MDTSRIDMLSLVGIPLDKTANTNGGEWHGECPFCGGKDRFWVAPNDKSGRPMAYCRHCNPKGWDAIAFIQQRDNLGFKAACQYLSLTLENNYQPAPKRPTMPMVKDTDREKPAANSEDWQEGTDKFVWGCIKTLKTAKGKLAMDYLLSRGLSEWVIEVAGLGYNLRNYENHWGGQKVYMPMGITIPWELGSKYTALRVRRQGPKEGQDKYAQAAGMVQSLYYPIHWKQHPFGERSIAVLVEGEFDALAMQTVLYNMTDFYHVHPCAVGSVTNGRTLANVLALAQAKKVLVAFDDDQAGREGAQWWLGQLPNAEYLKPLAHDPNDMLINLGWQATAEWLHRGIYA